jgi:hypothetical protein
VARKGEQDPARQRQPIEDLRHGNRTTEAEAVLQRLDAIHQALLSKLTTLSRDECIGPTFGDGL